MESDRDSDHDGTIDESIFTPVPETPEDLAEKLSELQTMMVELKDGFLTAMGGLSQIESEDQNLKEQIASNKREQDTQISEVGQLVRELKDDFQKFVSELHTTNEKQQTLEHQVELLSQQREVLVEELERVGHLTKESRHRIFLNPAGGRDYEPLNGNHVISDHDSGVTTFRHGDFSSFGEATPPLHMPLSPLVKPFIDGLPRVLSEDLAESYESDSSLMAIVNKSMDLSRTLEDKCHGLNQSDSSDDEGSDDTKLSSHTRKIKHSPTKTANSQYRSPPHEKSYRGSQRTRVVREILDTERKYCMGLWVIIDTFSEPIKQSGLLSVKDLGAMFPSSLNRLYEHHCKLLQKLEQRLSSSKYECVLGDVFVRLADSDRSDILGTYRIYVHDFPASVSLVNNWTQQSRRFKKITKKCAKNPQCEGLDLTSFLLTPIQRIPRYVLLLKQLLKYTEEDHPDYYYIEMSLDRLKVFLTTLNHSVERSMQLVSPGGSSVPSTSKRKIPSNHSVRSSSSSHEGMTKDSGVHSNGEEQRKGLRYPPKSIFKPERSHVGGGRMSDSSDCVMDPSIVPGIPQDKSSTSSKPQTHSRDAARREKHRKQRAQKQYGGEEESRPRSAYHHNEVAVTDRGRRSKSEHRTAKLTLQANRLSDEESFQSQLDLSVRKTEPSHKTERHEKPNVRKRESKGPVVKYHGPGTTTEIVSNSYKDLVGLDDEVLAQHIAKMRDGGARTLPRVTMDYGIYGDNDSFDDDCLYEPSIINDSALTRRAQNMGHGYRSQSHGDMLRVGRDSPRFESTPGPSKVALDVARSRRSNGLAKRDRPPPEYVQTLDRPEKVKQNVWNESMNGGNNVPTNESQKRQKLKDKKKNRHRQVIENLSKNESGEGLKKKKSLRDSLKSIFFGKRHNSSKVVEIEHAPAPPGFADVSFSDTDRTVANQTTDLSPAVVTLDVSSTYKDENGEPCSAV